MLMIMNNLDPAVAQVSLEWQLFHPDSRGFLSNPRRPFHPLVPPGAGHLRGEWPGLQ